MLQPAIAACAPDHPASRTAARPRFEMTNSSLGRLAKAVPSRRSASPLTILRGDIEATDALIPSSANRRGRLLLADGLAQVAEWSAPQAKRRTIFGHVPACYRHQRLACCYYLTPRCRHEPLVLSSRRARACLGCARDRLVRGHHVHPPAGARLSMAMRAHFAAVAERGVRRNIAQGWIVFEGLWRGSRRRGMLRCTQEE